MTFRTLVIRSLLYFRRSNLAIMLGTMIGAAILTGALIIGDSMKFSLKKTVFERLGKTEYVFFSPHRTINIDIAEKMAESINVDIAPIIQSKGIVSINGGATRINNIQIIGINRDFKKFGNMPNISLKENEIIINKSLALKSKLKIGDEIILRISIPSLIPIETSISVNKKNSIARRFKIISITTENEFGNFNINNSQIVPDNVFLSISQLSKLLKLKNSANLLLISKKKNIALKKKDVLKSFISAWQPSDAGISINNIENTNVSDIKSERIFIDPYIENSIEKTVKQSQKILTYFVNSISSKKLSTPYSFISSPPNSKLFKKLSNNEITINQWLASDLNLVLGDEIKISYYIVNSLGFLEERSNKFVVKDIIPMKKPFVDLSLIPDFPGLADAENCRDWDPGIPLDLKKIRDKDEDYWDNYRGSPKAYISLFAAQRMWKNSFGKITSIRVNGIKPDEVWGLLKKNIAPESLGFRLIPVKKQGLSASRESVDFSVLFLGLSFFIIIASLLLLGLLFVFSIQKRINEKGLLLALGFSKKSIKKIIMIEGSILTFIGSLLGIGFAILYTKFILWGIKTLWNDISGISVIFIYLKPTSLLFGMIISFFTVLIIIYIITKKFETESINSIQRKVKKTELFTKKTPKISLVITIIGSLFILTLLFFTGFGSRTDQVIYFFISGPVFLITGLAFFNIIISRFKVESNKKQMGLNWISLRNLGRSSKRAISLTALLACGIFIVFTVGANKKNALKDSDNIKSGTGGFKIFIQTDIPVPHKPETVDGEKIFGLNQKLKKQCEYISFRMKEGDDASCLNLNRISTPTIIGVDPKKLSKRQAFTFSTKSKIINKTQTWESLNMILPDGSIPAIADQTVIKWSLGKKIDDKLIYINEKGERFKITLIAGLANSIFQGKLIISTKNLKKHYPSISGYKLFLIDNQKKNTKKIISELKNNLEDFGIDIKTASNKLDEFNQVENTYLNIFLILGSFGILLGSIGLGIVILRNVSDRQGEFAILRAIGFNIKKIRKIILIEHLIIFISGSLIGILSSILAVLPGFFTPGADIPILTLIVLFLLIIMNGFAWTYFSVKISVNKAIINALRID